MVSSRSLNSFPASTLLSLLHEAESKKPYVYYAKSTHAIYLTLKHKLLDDNHVFNRQVINT